MSVIRVFVCFFASRQQHTLCENLCVLYIFAAAAAASSNQLPSSPLIYTEFSLPTGNHHYSASETTAPTHPRYCANNKTE